MKILDKVNLEKETGNKTLRLLTTKPLEYICHRHVCLIWFNNSWKIKYVLNPVYSTR